MRYEWPHKARDRRRIGAGGREHFETRGKIELGVARAVFAAERAVRVDEVLEKRQRAGEAVEQRLVICQLPDARQIERAVGLIAGIGTAVFVVRSLPATDDGRCGAENRLRARRSENPP